MDESWDSFSDADKRQMVETIDAQASHLGRIVTDLIDVARDRLQNVRLDKVHFRAADLAREAIKGAASSKQVDTRLDETVVVEADGDRIHQVLVNLLTNAVRYGHTRVLVVVTRAEDAVWFQVHDDGAGVPPKHQYEIWERFERGANKFNATVPGSGIGLSVARDLVSAHGGTIQYRQSPDLGGACFEFSLPLTTVPAEELVTS